MLIWNDILLDLESWYDLRYRRDVVDLDTMSRHGFRVYTIALASIFLLVWGLTYTVALLAVTKADRYRFLAGLLAAIVLRSMFLIFVDLKSLDDLVDREFYEEWVMSFQDSRDSNPQKYKTSRVSVQFKFEYIIAINLVAAGFIVLGVKLHQDRWALWTGLAIIIELVLRLAIEAVFRKIQASRVVKIWLKQQGMW